MRLPFADTLDRHPRLRRAREVLSFADARARDVRMGQVAGSLTFTTMLSVVPIFAVALALFTTFPLFARFRGELENFLLKALPGQISGTVLRYVNEFASQATELTAVGLAFLAVTALTMIVTVDRVLNDIWRVRDRRPFGQRVLIYWAILSLGPLVIGASLSASSFLWSLSAEAVRQLPRLLRHLLDYAPVVLNGFAYAALYVFVPNRSVAWRDALIGGFIAAVLGEFVKGTLRRVRVARRRAIGLRRVRGRAVLPRSGCTSRGTCCCSARRSPRRCRDCGRRASPTSRALATSSSPPWRCSRRCSTRRPTAGRRCPPANSRAPCARRWTRPNCCSSRSSGWAMLRRAATTLTGRAREQDWLLVCDTTTTTLAPVFGRFAIDPTNTLLSVASLGLAPVQRRWSEAEWLRRADGPVARFRVVRERRLAACASVAHAPSSRAPGRTRCTAAMPGTPIAGCQGRGPIRDSRQRRLRAALSRASTPRPPMTMAASTGPVVRSGRDDITMASATATNRAPITAAATRSRVPWSRRLVAQDYPRALRDERFGRAVRAHWIRGAAGRCRARRGSRDRAKASILRRAELGQVTLTTSAAAPSTSTPAARSVKRTNRGSLVSRAAREAR